MVCSNCNKDKYIVNKHFVLCLDCNRGRLNGSKAIKDKSTSFKKDTTFKTAKNKNNGGSSFVKNFVSNKNKDEKIKEDEIFYEECFNLSDHKCEECGCQLPTEFRDNDGKVIARWRYSHIIPKSIAPELRHSTKNINHLCLKHHMEWENGVKNSMKIFLKNKIILPNHF